MLCYVILHCIVTYYVLLYYSTYNICICIYIFMYTYIHMYIFVNIIYIHIYRLCMYVCMHACMHAIIPDKPGEQVLRFLVFLFYSMYLSSTAVFKRFNGSAQGCFMKSGYWITACFAYEAGIALPYVPQDPPCGGGRRCMYACMSICMYVCLYVCLYVCNACNVIIKWPRIRKIHRTHRTVRVIWTCAGLGICGL